MTTGRRTLSQQDWLLAGQELLREGGAPAVKLQALTRRLGVTTGSFYHHFTDVPSYLDALADHYGVEQVRGALAGLAGRDPLDRLAGLAQLAEAWDMGRLDRAMREWAATSPHAAAAVRRADETLLTFVADAFADLGFDRRSARTRALLLLSLAVARVHHPWGEGAIGADDVLRVLATAPPP